MLPLRNDGFECKQLHFWYLLRFTLENVPLHLQLHFHLNLHLWILTLYFQLNIKEFLSDLKCLALWIELLFRSSCPEVFLEKGVLQIRSKFTEKHPCRSVISLKLLYNFIEIALRHGCSPVKLLHIFRTPFLRNTFVWLLLYFWL